MQPIVYILLTIFNDQRYQRCSTFTCSHGKNNSYIISHTCTTRSGVKLGQQPPRNRTHICIPIPKPYGEYKANDLPLLPLSYYISTPEPTNACQGQSVRVAAGDTKNSNIAYLFSPNPCLFCSPSSVTWRSPCLSLKLE